MSYRGSVTLYNRRYESTTNLLPFALGAWATNVFLRHAAPKPWRNIPSPAVWCFAIGCAALTFRKVDMEPERKPSFSFDMEYEGKTRKVEVEPEVKQEKIDPELAYHHHSETRGGVRVRDP